MREPPADFKVATMRTELLRFNGAVERAPAIDAWMREHTGELGAIAHHLKSLPSVPRVSDTSSIPK